VTANPKRGEFLLVGDRIGQLLGALVAVEGIVFLGRPQPAPRRSGEPDPKAQTNFADLESAS
jgi:hypothetical protein